MFRAWVFPVRNHSSITALVVSDPHLENRIHCQKKKAFKAFVCANEMGMVGGGDEGVRRYKYAGMRSERSHLSRVIGRTEQKNQRKGRLHRIRVTGRNSTAVISSRHSARSDGFYPITSHE